MKFIRSMIKMPNIIHITRADDLSISNNQLVMIDEDNNDEKNKISLNDISAIVLKIVIARLVRFYS